MHDGLVGLAIALLFAGAFAALYFPLDLGSNQNPATHVYPFQLLGYVLVLGAIICIAVVLFTQRKKKKILKFKLKTLSE